MLKTKWTPKKGELHWIVTKVFTSDDGEQVFRIEKYQGGRNSPALITMKKLKEQFVKQ